MSGSKDEYWFTWDAEDVCSKLIEHHDKYCGASYNPVWQMWQRNTYAYYSTVLDAQSWFTALNFVGEQGEMVKMSVPQARSLTRQLLTLITKQKLAFKAIAEVDNSAVTDEVRIASALCEQVVTDQELDIRNEAMVEDGLVVGTGFIKTTWRTDLGLPVAIKEGQEGAEGPDAKDQIIYEGDVEITTPSVLDVTYNFQLERWEDQEWVECRVKRNRWTMIAQHPELAVEIKRLPSANSNYGQTSYLGFDDDDQIYVYEVYHKPTPALPRGRMIVYSDAETIYYDDINPYDCIPIEQYKPEPIKGIGYGYPMLSNLLPAQEMYDHEFSCLATNHSALGVQNVTCPREANVDVEEILGMNFISYTPQNVPGGGKPEALQLLKDSPATAQFQQSLLGNMQQMANINSAVRGEVSEGTSGVAIATLTTNALEFLTSYSKCMNMVLEKVLMHSINAYRRFAKTERLVRMTGKNDQTFSKKFTGDQLSPIRQIKIQQVNPLMMTIAGRVDVATNAIKTGLITNMQEYVSILDGEPLSRLYESDLSQNDLIHTENERMSSGQPVAALSIDNHPLHILKHKTLLNDPIIRMNSQLAQSIMDHILEHNDLQASTDPALMAMANTGKAPQMAAPMALPPGPGPQQRPNPEQQGGKSAAGPASIGPEQQGGKSRLEKGAQAQDAQMSKPTSQPAQPARDLLGRGAA